MFQYDEPESRLPKYYNLQNTVILHNCHMIDLQEDEEGESYEESYRVLIYVYQSNIIIENSHT